MNDLKRNQISPVFKAQGTEGRKRQKLFQFQQNQINRFSAQHCFIVAAVNHFIKEQFLQLHTGFGPNLQKQPELY